MYDIKRLQNNEEAMKLPNFATLLNMLLYVRMSWKNCVLCEWFTLWLSFIEIINANKY